MGSWWNPHDKYFSNEYNTGRFIYPSFTYSKFRKAQNFLDAKKNNLQPQIFHSGQNRRDQRKHLFSHILNLSFALCNQSSEPRKRARIYAQTRIHAHARMRTHLLHTNTHIHTHTTTPPPHTHILFSTYTSIRHARTFARSHARTLVRTHASPVARTHTRKQYNAMVSCKLDGFLICFPFHVFCLVKVVIQRVKVTSHCCSHSAARHGTPPSPHSTTRYCKIQSQCSTSQHSCHSATVQCHTFSIEYALITA